MAHVFRSWTHHNSCIVSMIIFIPEQIVTMRSVVFVCSLTCRTKSKGNKSFTTILSCQKSKSLTLIDFREALAGTSGARDWAVS